MRRREFLALSSAAFLVRPAFRAEPRLVERWSWAMGQPVHLRLFHADEAAGLEAAQAALAELRRVEGVLSRFDDTSALSELNRRAGRGWLDAGPELPQVLAEALRFRAATGGAFDIAVEPLMRAWGFREPRKAAPGERELAEARAAVAAATIEVSGVRIRLPVRHTQLDLGGVGVGYGLDRAGAELRRQGVERALLEVSGDLLALGAPPGSDGWLVDIADPERPGSILASTTIRDAALATSGQSAATVELSGRSHGHVMDPATGRPATRLLQATVTARTARAADALSTATLVRPADYPGVWRRWTT
jgi:thiamine biosynthesis lipoprotein